MSLPVPHGGYTPRRGRRWYDEILAAVVLPPMFIVMFILDLTGRLK